MAHTSNQKLLKKLQLAQAELAEGSPIKAIKMLQKLLKPSANNPNILYLIGLAYGKLGKPDKVKQISLKTLKLTPAHYGTLCNLANALFLEGDIEGAQDNYKKALQLKPDEPRIIDSYCIVLKSLGQYSEVIDLLDRLLIKHPMYVRAYVAQGGAYTELGKQEKAFELYKAALEIDPFLIDANLGMGNLHQLTGSIRVSKKYYQAVLDIDENNSAAYIGLATLKRLVGDYDIALKIIEKAEGLVPNHPVILATKADILEHSGQFDEAFKLLQLLKNRGHLSAISVASYANMSSRFNVCDEALQLLEQTINLQATSNVDKSVLYYASGQLLDKLKRYSEAFKHYHLANTCVNNDFNEKDNVEFIDNCIITYSIESIKEYPRSTIKNSRPVFILGMPRSGTSLCEQILAAHPDVFGAGELGDITSIAKKITSLETKYEGGNLTWMTNLPVKTLNSYTSLYLDSVASINSTERYVTDKMPHNFKYIGLISMLFPDARIIHCTRNPMDNILSIYFQNFSGSHRYATNLKNIAFHYNSYRRLMRHWKEAIDMPIFTVSYENMVLHQEETSRELLKFCELDWNDDVLQFHKTKRSVGTASYAQVRQPMYKTSKDRWKNYEKYLNEVKIIVDVN